MHPAGRFFQNFYNADVVLDKRISEQAIQASWNIAASSSSAASFACVPTWTHAEEVNAALLAFLGEKTGNVPKEVA